MKIIEYYLKSIIFFIVLFIVHRFISVPLLSQNIELHEIGTTSVYFVGLLSDMWIAFLGAVLFSSLLFCISIIKKIKKDSTYNKIFYFFHLIFLFFTVVHIGYIEFFHHTIIPFHLSYLSDIEFIQANSKSAFEFKNVFIFLLLSVILFSIGHFVSFKYLKNRNKLILSLALALISTAAHVVNIKNRIQWFIPDQLQMNYFEKLHANYKFDISPHPLSKQELQALKINSEINIYRAMTAQQGSIQDEFHLKVKKIFQSKTNIGDRPLIITLLSESLRNGDISMNLTPNIWQLLRSGIRFTNTWSSGTVTRGGQEAVFCGYPGSVSDSTMRNRSNIQLKCLPDVITEGTFWLHGGEGKFDSQESFWSKHQMKVIKSLKDFPADLPRTGWGIGDVSFMPLAVDQIVKFRESTEFNYDAGMILSVSNHIPWDMPNDAPLNIKKANFQHPSYKTIHYFDYAVKMLVEKLKSENLWDRSIVIIVGDHGNHIDEVNSDKSKYYSRLVNVANILTGGIVEQATGEMQTEFKTYKHTSSQTDISQMLVDLLDLNIQTFAENLFLEKRTKPIYSDLGNSIYIPELDKELYKESFIKPVSKLEDQISTEQLAAIYYRSFSLLTNNWDKYPKE